MIIIREVGIPMAHGAAEIARTIGLASMVPGIKPLVQPFTLW